MKEKNEFFLYSRKLKMGDGTMKLTLAGFIMALLFSFPISSFALGEYSTPPLQSNQLNNSKLQGQ